MALVNGVETEEPIDVLDLPQLYQRPSASILLTVLNDLKLAPLSWDTPTTHSTSSRPKINEDGIPAYLTKIVSSPLTWIEDEAQREQIWNLASKCLSERSGRSAMGDLTRTFKIPISPVTSASTKESEILEIQLHEPALTSDNLGLKTWASSYLLAKRLPHLVDVLATSKGGSDEQILELGAGTGLVGLAAAAIFKAHVVLTDLPEIVENLERNRLANQVTISKRGGSAETTVLDWNKPSEMFTRSSGSGRQAMNSFRVILAADPIYSPEHPKLFVDTVERHLSKDNDAMVVVELPLREMYAAERLHLRQRMEGAGLMVLEDGEEVGFDDWGSGEGEGGLAEVRCWWSIWGWR